MKTASVIEKKTRISLVTTFSLSCLWLFCLFCNTLHAEAPSWWSQSNVVTQQHVMAIMARVQTPDGTILKTPGSKIAVFHGEEPILENLRAVAVFDDDDGYYFYNLTVAVVSNSESGYTFFYYDPLKDKISNLELPDEYKDEPLPYNEMGYGGFPPPDYEFDPFMLTLPEEPVPTDLTVTWNLKTGWNWVSMNVVPENAGVANVLAEYTPTSGDQIKSSTASSTYYVTSKFTGWSPALNLQPGVMYMLRRQASDAATVEISGTPCAADNTINIKAGWNWIGLFNNKETMDITSLFHDGGFANSDQLKGQTVSATYYITSKFTGWSGNLKQLSNNQGYKLKVTNPGILSCAGETRGHVVETPVTRGGSCPWPNPNEYTAYNMTFCVVIKKADGSYLENTDTVVGIFQGDTIIGKATFTETPFGNVYEGFIYNDSTKVENLAIKVWDGEANKEIALDQTTTFEADTVWGDEFEPFELSMSAPIVKPTVTVTATDATATEPLTNTTATDTATFTFKRTGDTTAALTVKFTVSGTATSGTDYTSIGTSVTIPAGQDSATKIVTPKYDTTSDDGETVIVTLATDDAYIVGTPNTATATIKEIVLPVVTVTAEDATATEPTSSTASATDTGKFRFTRTGDTTDALVVWYTVAGTATSGTDYDSIGTSVTIPAGWTSITKTVTPKYDTLSDNGETVILTLSSNAKYTIGAQKTATVTIKEPVPSVPTITITAVDNTTTEPDSTTATVTDKASLRITRSGNATAAVTVNFSFGGTATPGADYSAGASSVTLPASSSTVTMTLGALYDTLNEGDETVVVSLVASSSYNIGSESSATVTIKDVPPVITANASPAEGGSVSGGYVTTPGQNYKLTATANEGYTFSKWTKADGSTASTANPYTFSVTGPETYTAVFEGKPETTDKYAIRQLPVSYMDGAEIDVNIKVDITSLEGAVGFSVYDAIPAGTSLVPDSIIAPNASDAKEEDGQIVIAQLTNPNILTMDISYKLVADEGMTDDIAFTGKIIARYGLGDKVEQAISGDSILSHAPTTHPADANDDYVIQTEELGDYVQAPAYMSRYWGKNGYHWDEAKNNWASGKSGSAESSVHPADANKDYVIQTEELGDFVQAPAYISRYWGKNGYHWDVAKNNWASGKPNMTRGQEDIDDEPVIPLLRAETSYANRQLPESFTAGDEITVNVKVDITSLEGAVGFSVYETIPAGTSLVANSITAPGASDAKEEDGQIVVAQLTNPSLLTMDISYKLLVNNDVAGDLSFTGKIIARYGLGDKIEQAIGGDDVLLGTPVDNEPIVVSYEEYPWNEVDVYKPYNMTFCVILLQPDGDYWENANTVVGIFQEDICIGTAVYTDSPFGIVYEGFIYNDATRVEGLGIKVWFGDTKQELTLKDQTTDFVADTVWGDEFEPVVLSLGWIPIPDNNYTVTVENGTPETIDAIAGETVTIKANEPEEHMLFEKWTSEDGVEFDNAFAAETTFTMLAKNVTVTANYIPEPKYTITVIKGTATKKEAYEGETIIVTADEPEEHMRFDKWTSDYDPIDNTTGNPLPVGMPAKNVTITANYVPEPKYTITVKNGKPDKDTAYAGDTVTVTASEPEAGFVFDKWTSNDGVEFADAFAAVTSFPMLAENVFVTATYKSADQSLRFWLEADSTTTVAPGDVVVVRLLAKNLTGIGMVSFGCDVNFNADDLEAISVVNSEIFSAAVGGVIVENGIKGLSGTTENDSVGVGGEPVELATMEFVVKNKAAANINIDLGSFNGSVVDATVEDGALKISGDALTLNVVGGMAVVPEFAIEFEAHQQTRAANVALKVGMAENASLAYDEAEGDVTAFPAFENVYDVRVIDGRRAEELQTDIRGLANRETWNVQVTVGEGQSLTLDWSDAVLPEYFNFTIVKGKYFNDSEVIDMAEETFMAFDEGVTYITIIADKKPSVLPEATYTFNLTPGWNLIGVPFDMDAESLAKFTSVLAVYTYDEETQAYIQYEDTTALSAGCAYWVFVNEATEITVKGTAIEAEGVALKAGWNWVTPLNDSVLALPQGVVKSVWFYTADGYRQATEDDEIQIGCGYWVYSEEDTVIWQTK